MADPVRLPAERSAELRWPAFDDLPAMSLRALAFQLDESQWWPPALIERMQLRQLGVLLDHAHAQVPHWREVLSRMSRPPGAPIAPDAWAALPVLSREAFAGSGASAASGASRAPGAPRTSIRAAQVPRGHEALGPARAGDSGPAPTPITELFAAALGLRDATWQRVDPAGRLALIRPSPPGAPQVRELIDWGGPIATVWRTGPASVVDARAPLARQARWLARGRFQVLQASATHAHALAAHCVANGVRVDGLVRVLVSGAGLPDAARATIERAWAAPVADAVVARDVGVIALRCPGRPHHHVMSEAVRVDVLDDDGRACEPGEAGRVVATPLHNFATPLIRVDTGLRAAPGPRCACGRGLPVLVGVEARGRPRS